jgi:hypothetical protein
MKAEITALVTYDKKEEFSYAQTLYYADLSINKRIVRLSIPYMDFVTIKDLTTWKETKTENTGGNLTIYRPATRTRK